MVSPAEVRQVVETGAIVEDYPEDPRGRSCLMLALCQGRPVHVVCSPKEDYLAIITAYIPDRGEWEDGWKVRDRS